MKVILLFLDPGTSMSSYSTEESMVRLWACSPSCWHTRWKQESVRQCEILKCHLHCILSREVVPAWGFRMLLSRLMAKLAEHIYLRNHCCIISLLYDFWSSKPMIRCLLCSVDGPPVNSHSSRLFGFSLLGKQIYTASRKSVNREKLQSSMPPTYSMDWRHGPPTSRTSMKASWGNPQSTPTLKS